MVEQDLHEFLARKKIRRAFLNEESFDLNEWYSQNIMRNGKKHTIIRPIYKTRLSAKKAFIRMERIKYLKEQDWKYMYYTENSEDSSEERVVEVTDYHIVILER